MKKISYILLFLISFQGVAQTFADKEHYLIDSLVLEDLSKIDRQLVDSCLNLFHTAKHDTDRVSAIEMISENSWNIELWSRYNDWVNDFISAKLSVKSSPKTRQYLKEAHARTLSNYGYVCLHNGDIVKGLEYYSKCLKIQEELGDKSGIGTSLANLGYVYESQGDVEKGLEFYKKALKIQRETGNMIGVATSLNNIGLANYKLGNVDKGLDYFQKSLEVQIEIDNRDGMALCFNNIGGIYKSKGDIDKALEYTKKSLKLHEEMEDYPGVAHSLNRLGECYLIKENFSEASKYAERSLEVANKLGYPINIRQAAVLLSNVYEKQGKGMKALTMHKLYIAMRDSISNEATQKATAQQQAQYEYEKRKAIDDAEHDKLLAIEQEGKEKQQILTIATSGGLGLVIIFLIFVFNRLQVTKKQKMVIEEQKQEVEQQKEEVEQAHYELEEKNKEIMDSITYAKRIQSAILPPAKVVKEYLQESFILYKPKDIVAGDFYWLEQKDGKVLFAAADCTGHGVPGAMVSVVCNNALNRSVREHGLTDPGEILNKSREIVVAEFEKSDEEVKDGMDIALCSLEGNTLQYAGAHNPLWIIRKGEIIETKADKQPIGKFIKPLPYTTHTFELQKEDAIYIFSDGYVDQFGGEKGKKLKTKAFKELLLSIQDKDMEEQKIIIDDTFEAWKGNLEQIDDVCIIGVRV